MMRCPVCGNTYSNKNSYCLEDGTILVEEVPPTIIVNPDIITPRSSRPGINPLFAILPTVLLALLAGGLIFYWIRMAGGNDDKNNPPINQMVTIANKPNTNQPVVSNPPKVEDKSGGVNSSQTYRVVRAADKFLSIRSEADPKSREIARIPIDAVVEVDPSKGKKIYKEKTWIFVNYKGNSGWVNSYYLEKQ